MGAMLWWPAAPSPSNAIYILIAPSHCSSGVSICLMTCCTMYNNHGLHCTLLNMSCNCMTKCRSFTVSCCSWTVTELEVKSIYWFCQKRQGATKYQKQPHFDNTTWRVQCAMTVWSYIVSCCLSRQSTEFFFFWLLYEKQQVITQQQKHKERQKKTVNFKIRSDRFYRHFLVRLGLLKVGK